MNDKETREERKERMRQILEESRAKRAAGGKTSRLKYFVIGAVVFAGVFAFLVMAGNNTPSPTPATASSTPVAPAAPSLTIPPVEQQLINIVSSYVQQKPQPLVLENPSISAATCFHPAQTACRNKVLRWTVTCRTRNSCSGSRTSDRPTDRRRPTDAKRFRMTA